MPFLTILIFILSSFHLDFIEVQTYKDKESSNHALEELTKALSGLGKFKLT